MIHNTNEVTWVPSGYSDRVWINYRTCGGTNGNIQGYYFGRGNGNHIGFYVDTGGAYHTSDIRKKYDIHDILYKDIIDLFNTENGYIRHFKWKETNKDSYGFIAQEIMEYCPECINKDDQDYLSVEYNIALSKIVGAMFKKIKELDKKVKEQDIIIKNLKGDS